MIVKTVNHSYISGMDFPFVHGVLFLSCSSGFIKGFYVFSLVRMSCSFFVWLVDWLVLNALLLRVWDHCYANRFLNTGRFLSLHLWISSNSIRMICSLQLKTFHLFELFAFVLLCRLLDNFLDFFTIYLRKHLGS